MLSGEIPRGRMCLNRRVGGPTSRLEMDPEAPVPPPPAKAGSSVCPNSEDIYIQNVG